MIKININDVTENIEVPNNIWPAIFEKQMTLAEKYKDIENMGNLLETTNNNVDTEKGQKWIKDFAWRVTEELAEAYEAFYQIKQNDYSDHNKQLDLHFKEELADALHFLVELTIIAGYDYKIVCEYTKNPRPNPWDTVYQLGLMCNCLKNKPWKQTQMLTDRPKFESYLKATWREFIQLLIAILGSEEEIYLFYFKKNKVNQFRQRSKY